MAPKHTAWSLGLCVFGFGSSASEAQLLVGAINVSDDHAHDFSQSVLTTGIQTALLPHHFGYDLSDQLQGHTVTKKHIICWELVKYIEFRKVCGKKTQ